MAIYTKYAYKNMDVTIFTLDPCLCHKEVCLSQHEEQIHKMGP